jgi:hypothetical protein
MLIGSKQRIADSALAKRLLTVYGYRDHVVAGGLVSYGVDLRWCFRRAAYFVDKILRGAAPGDLPVEFPTKMVLAVNLRTASALDITVPPTLLTRAEPVQGRRHPGNSRMLDPTLDIGDAPAGIALVPGAVELLSGRAKLYEQVAGQVLGIRLSPRVGSGPLRRFP